MGIRRADDPPLYFETHVFVCCNRRPAGHPRGSCAARGSERIRDYFKARVKELGLRGVRINSALCLDRCELGPCAVFYPEGVWYRLADIADVERVLALHLERGERVPELMLPGPEPAGPDSSNAEPSNAERGDAEKSTLPRAAASPSLRGAGEKGVPQGG